MNLYLSTGGLFTAVSVLLFLSGTTNGFLAMLRCLTLAFGILLLTMGILACLHIKKRNLAWLYGVGVLVMGCYTLIAADTYLFHVMNWFPGLIRYPLFSLYGIGYLLFAIPGLFLYVGSAAENG